MTQHKFSSSTVRMVKLGNGWYRVMAASRVVGMVREDQNGEWIADIGDSAPYTAPSRMTAVGLCLSAYYDGFDPSGEEAAHQEAQDQEEAEVHQLKEAPQPESSQEETGQVWRGRVRQQGEPLKHNK